MGSGLSRLSGGAVAVAAILVTGGGVAARAVESAASNARESGAARSATGTARAIEAAVDGVSRTIDTLVLLAPEIARTPAAAPPALAQVLSPDGIAAVALVPVRGTAVRVAGTLPAGAALATLGTSLRPALELARDTADPHAGAIPGGVGIAVAVYGGPAASTQARRAGVTAWVVGLVNPAALVGRVASPGDEIVVQVGGVTVTAATPRGRVAAEATARLAGQPVTAVVSPKVEGGAAPIAWGMLLAALAGAAGALYVGWRGGEALAASRAATEALERETRTVAEIGPLLQQSLDLAEVLPAVAVRLADEFDLESFAVELIGEHGALVDVFAAGRRVPGEPQVVFGVAGVAAGTEVALPLLRAGRTIGRLRLTPRSHLTPVQVDALRGAADLIAVATYNVELYEREQATVKRLQDLDQLKDAFLGTISHELRTPITAIVGFVRMLNDRWDDLAEEQRRDFLRRVDRNSSSLGLLVDDLLDFARLERQALSTNVAAVPLDVIIESFATQVAPALGDHHIATDLARGVTALADPRAIERILANLLTNAAKFSPPGSSVDVTLREDESYAVLTVSDCGPGIPEEDRLRVFTRFYRGDSESARSTRGAGIGLAVVHELVTQMGGEVEVQGRVPHGTTMVVRLPLAAAAEPPSPRTAIEDDLIPARSTP